MKNAIKNWYFWAEILEKYHRFNMTTLAEQPCYTLINILSDSEPPSEQKLKEDIGEYRL